MHDIQVSISKVPLSKTLTGTFFLRSVVVYRAIGTYQISDSSVLVVRFQFKLFQNFKICLILILNAIYLPFGYVIKQF